MNFFEEAKRRQEDAKSPAEAIRAAFKTCEICAIKGIRRSCDGCPFASPEEILKAFHERKAKEKSFKAHKRKYNMGADHRCTTVFGVYRRLGIKNFRSLVKNYEIPEEITSAMEICNYAASHTRKYARMNIADEIVRDFNNKKNP